MKAEIVIQSRIPSGLLEAKAFYTWKETVAGFRIPLAIHIAPRDGNEIMLTELSTGFDTRIKVMRPGTNERLTVAHALKMPGKLVKRQARTAFHHWLKKKGEIDFLRSVAIARAQVEAAGEALNAEYEVESVSATELGIA